MYVFVEKNNEKTIADSGAIPPRKQNCACATGEVIPCRKPRIFLFFFFQALYDRNNLRISEFAETSI